MEASSHRRVARNVAARLLSQPWTLAAVDVAIRVSLPGVHHRTRAALAVRVFALGEDSYPPDAAAIVAFLLGSEFFEPKAEGPVVLEPPVFAPLPPFAGLAIPALATVGELAEWLLLSAEALDWFSGERRPTHGSAKLRHYHPLFRRKRDGTVRLVEAPKPRLKGIQRRLLREILAPVPVHGSAHGFVPGRSCLSGAQVHAGEAVVACFDLAQFFPSIAAPRVHGLFRALGYPGPVARRLTGLCTTVTPADVADRLAGGQRDAYRAPHLPQGAPTSPALANLLAWRLDRRLSGLARAAEANYTRYADDLAFSGPGAASLGAAVAAIAAEEGFGLNPAKTRVMPRHGAQVVTGLVVNDHLNVDRATFDRLKAILHNCGRGAPSAQNRAGVADFRRHLDGRIAWVEQVDRRRGGKLRRLFERIDWSLDTPTPRS